MTANRSSAVSSPNNSQTTRQLRVVVVDDEPDTVMTLLALLRDEGHDAEGFASGQKGLEAIGQINPDVVISDISMPPPNGWDLAREVRRLNGEDPRPLMIAITGRYTKGADRILAQMAGFNYFLTKPCDPQVLMALVEKARPLQS